MKSYNTIEEARTAHQAHARKSEIIAILEIEPGLPGVERYILSLCNLATLRAALKNKPMAEVKAIIGVAVDLAAERRATLAASCATNVPGLHELEAALNNEERYSREFERMMEDGNNDGVNPPRPISVSTADVAAKYPIAAAYHKAECWAKASHYAKSGAGKRAKVRIAGGEAWEKVIGDMEAEWSKHTQAHAWD